MNLKRRPRTLKIRPFVPWEGRYFKLPEAPRDHNGDSLPDFAVDAPLHRLEDIVDGIATTSVEESETYDEVAEILAVEQAAERYLDRVLPKHVPVPFTVSLYR